MSLVLTEKTELSSFTSWMVGGPADFFALPTTIDEVHKAQAWANEKQIPITVISGGTNILVSDLGIEGLVICLRKLKGIEIKSTVGRLQFEALAGTPKATLLKTFLSHKLMPALFLAGLPGDVGGGVVMNAGVGENFSPREFVEIVDFIDVAHEGKIKRFKKDELKWSYRHLEGYKPGIVVRAGFSWEMKPDSRLIDLVKDANKTRLHKQPLELPSCGSVFKNPPGQKSGSLIEKSNLKGFQIGGAQVSTKHANFIVNKNKATATDIHNVIEHVRSTVLAQFGVKLETEVVYLGRWNK